MMFRQGFGRLIRTRTDRGIVAVLDPRVVSKAIRRSLSALAARLRRDDRDRRDCPVQKPLEVVADEEADGADTLASDGATDTAAADSSGAA
jgi:hypothetical protein